MRKVLNTRRPNDVDGECVADDPGKRSSPATASTPWRRRHAGRDTPPTVPVETTDEHAAPHLRPCRGGRRRGSVRRAGWPGDRRSAGLERGFADQHRRPWVAPAARRSVARSGGLRPFLRAVDDGDRLVSRVEAPDPANRCAALRDPVPQSLAAAGAWCVLRRATSTARATCVAPWSSRRRRSR